MDTFLYDVPASSLCLLAEIVFQKEADTLYVSFRACHSFEYRPVAGIVCLADSLSGIQSVFGVS